MEKKDLYLSDEEINKAHAQGVYECMNLHKHKGSTPRIEGRKAVAKASADYAVKKVIEELMADLHSLTDGTILHGDYQVDCLTFVRILNKWEALKKLIGGS